MHNVVVTGSGFVTKFGTNFADIVPILQSVPQRKDFEEYSLQGFDSAKHLTNKRVLRSVSWYQGFGLAAVELCKKAAKLDQQPVNAPRMGMYVGAPPSSMFDNTNYIQPVQESRQADGSYSEKKFGSTCMNTLGTTLLLGLPNNVLCYGSMILNAKGPNSNYVSGDISGLLSLCNGAWKISDGKLDGAVVGGYSMSTDAVIMNMLEKQQLLFQAEGASDVALSANSLRGTIPADGSVFLMLETEESAARRGVAVLATFLGAGTAFSGKLRYLSAVEKNANDVTTTAHAIKQCLKLSNVTAKDIGLVFVSGSGVSYIDEAELEAVTPLGCPVASLAPVFGNLLEASGLLEVVAANHLYANPGEGLGSLSMQKTVVPFDTSKKVALVVRSSLAGDRVCVAYRMS